MPSHDVAGQFLRSLLSGLLLYLLHRIEELPLAVLMSRRPGLGERLPEALDRIAADREIAQTLFVTPKTVEYHLRNAYRKLGIERRQELGDALEA